MFSSDFGQEQPRLNFSSQSHCYDGSGNYCNSGFDALLSYFLLAFFNFSIKL